MITREGSGALVPNVFRKFLHRRHNQKEPSTPDNCFQLNIRASTDASCIQPAVAAYIPSYQHSYISTAFTDQRKRQPAISLSNTQQIELYWESDSVLWGAEGKPHLFRMVFWVTPEKMPCDVVLGNYKTWGCLEKFPDPIYNAQWSKQLTGKRSVRNLFGCRKSAAPRNAENPKQQKGRKPKKVLKESPEFQAYFGDKQQSPLAIVKLSTQPPVVVRDEENSTDRECPDSAAISQESYVNDTQIVSKDNYISSQEMIIPPSVRDFRSGPHWHDSGASNLTPPTAVIAKHSNRNSDATFHSSTFTTTPTNRDSILTAFTSATPSVRTHRPTNSDGSVTMRNGKFGHAYRGTEEGIRPISEQSSSRTSIPRPHSDNFDSDLPKLLVTRSSGSGRSRTWPQDKERKSLTKPKVSRNDDNNTHKTSFMPVETILHHTSDACEAKSPQAKQESADEPSQPTSKSQTYVPPPSPGNPESLPPKPSEPQETITVPYAMRKYMYSTNDPFFAQTPESPQPETKSGKGKLKAGVVKKAWNTPEERAAARASDTYWTWDEDVKKYHHVDSDGSGVWFMESDSEDDE